MMKSSIKEYIIKNFINEELRAPTNEEIKNLYRDLVEENPKAEEIGLLAGTISKYPIARNESSYKEYEDLFDKLLIDQKYLLNNYFKNINLLEEVFRTSKKQLNKTLSRVKVLERNANKNILLHLKEDIYNYGVVESFQDYSKVDFNRSNIAFYNGKATVGFKKVESDSFASEDISYTVRNRNGLILNQEEVSDIRNVSKEDGSHFKVIAQTSAPDDVVDFIVDVSFKNDLGVELETIKFTSYSPEKNSKISYRCLYSTDNTNYKPVFESDLRLVEGENYIEINRNKVRKIRLIITKYYHDFKNQREHNYVFSLDYLGFTRNEYKLNQESVLFLGPYEILDENDAPVNYSLATVKGGTCCIVPEETSVDIYISKDNINWYKSDFNKETKDVIQFDSSLEKATDFTLFDLVDEDSTSNYIAISGPEEIKLSAEEKLLNFYIPSNNLNKFIKNSLKIKRNTLKKSGNKLYGSSQGWYLNKDNFYETNLIVLQPEGRYFNFGNRSCYIDGRQVSGKVFLNKGTHFFKTSKENWQDLNLENEKEIVSSRQLQRIDNLYPYNHKYVVEGFSYSEIFRGKKVYLGADEVFSHEMEEVSNEKFKTSFNLKNFTTVETETGLYFKIQSKPTSSESKFEDFEIEYRRAGENSSNLLYIKGILKTFNSKVTPKIDQIQVRVI